MSPGDWGSEGRRRNRQLTVQPPRDQRSHRMVLYACSPGGSHICLHPFANVAGLASAIKKTRWPTGNFCDLRGCIVWKHDNSYHA
jgi:hypothetical protein